MCHQPSSPTPRQQRFWKPPRLAANRLRNQSARLRHFIRWNRFGASSGINLSEETLPVCRGFTTSLVSSLCEDREMDRDIPEKKEGRKGKRKRGKLSITASPSITNSSIFWGKNRWGCQNIKQGERVWERKPKIQWKTNSRPQRLPLTLAWTSLLWCMMSFGSVTDKLAPINTHVERTLWAWFASPAGSYEDVSCVERKSLKKKISFLFCSTLLIFSYPPLAIHRLNQ